MQRFGPAGIALGAAAGAYVNMGFNFATLTRKAGKILSQNEHRLIALSVAASVPAGFVGVATANRIVPDPLWASAGLGLAGFGLVYGVLTVVFGHPDARAMVRLNHKRGQDENV